VRYLLELTPAGPGGVLTVRRGRTERRRSETAVTRAGSSVDPAPQQARAPPAVPTPSGPGRSPSPNIIIGFPGLAGRGQRRHTLWKAGRAEGQFDLAFRKCRDGRLDPRRMHSPARYQVWPYFQRLNLSFWLDPRSYRIFEM
jgi:hypothetical protein